MKTYCQGSASVRKWSEVKEMKDISIHIVVRLVLSDRTQATLQLVVLILVLVAVSYRGTPRLNPPRHFDRGYAKARRWVYAVTGTLWDVFPQTIVSASQNNEKTQTQDKSPGYLIRYFHVPGPFIPPSNRSLDLSSSPSTDIGTRHNHNTRPNLFDTLKSSRVFIHRNGEPIHTPRKKAGTRTRRRVNSASRSINRIASYSNELTRLLNFAKTFPRNQLPIHPSRHGIDIYEKTFNDLRVFGFPQVSVNWKLIYSSGECTLYKEGLDLGRLRSYFSSVVLFSLFARWYLSRSLCDVQLHINVHLSSRKPSHSPNRIALHPFKTSSKRRILKVVTPTTYNRDILISLFAGLRHAAHIQYSAPLTKATQQRTPSLSQERTSQEKKTKYLPRARPRHLPLIPHCISLTVTSDSDANSNSSSNLIPTTNSSSQAKPRR
ncbi:hypothetical protein NLI96_g8804 [Meripilus lineatus]|uniref:Uncharacterized protein n=1 Tax=Meripilus lineatus TaxID=2056292 RepID=A0AAD5YDM9_9APHY|nr:hypothetical protein NLI96_g8804 [Physisporinus lineatus]